MTSVAIDEVGEGAVAFNARLLAIEDNLSAIPLAAGEAMTALEAFLNDTWALGVEDTPETDRRWPDHQPLVNTGALKASLTTPDAEGAIREIDAEGFTFGTSLFYGRFVQYGTSKMAPKFFFPDSEEVRAVIGRVMRDFILRGTGLEFVDQVEPAPAWTGAHMGRGAGGRFTSIGLKGT